MVARPDATICEIRDKFGQKGDSIISTKQYVLAYSINSEFWCHLQEFRPKRDINGLVLVLALKRPTNKRSFRPLRILNGRFEHWPFRAN